MTANFQQELNHIIEIKGRATRLDTLFQGYWLCARTEGKSENTIRIANTALTTLKGFLASREYPTDVTEIGVNELREFILHLQQVKAFEHHPYTGPQRKGLSGHAINTYLRSIRAFWSWLVREEIITSNPFSRVKVPKPPKKVIATFSEKQLTAILKAVNTSMPAGFRDWTIMLMLLDTGLRASELVGITMNDVNLEDGMVKVYGKGSKERVVPFGAKVQRAVWKYLQRYRSQPANPLCTTLFLTATGNPITTDRLRTIIEKYARKAGIEGVRCSPHTFRHTCAISYLRNGGDVFSLQRILGHSSLEIVRIYVNYAEADVKACHRRFSPADNMQIK
jgi:integrase/recombinase XerD